MAMKNMGILKTTPELWRKLKPLAREMRHEPTIAERHLWLHLRSQQHGFKFRRQHAIDRFIVDFYCSEAQLLVEVDGSIHQYSIEEDAMRQEFLESQGLRVNRFTNDEVLRDGQRVIAAITQALNQTPFPLQGEGVGGGV